MIGKKKHALHESTKNFLSYEWEITVKFQFVGATNPNLSIYSYPVKSNLHRVFSARHFIILYGKIFFTTLPISPPVISTAKSLGIASTDSGSLPSR